MSAQWSVLMSMFFCLFMASAAEAAGAAKAEAGPLRAAYAHVKVVVEGDVARTVVTEVFVNDLEFPVEATYVIPLPTDATVAGFAEWRDGVRTAAVVKGREVARTAYEAAVDRGERAALGERMGRRFSLSLYAIPAGGRRRVELTYVQTLSALGGERAYVFPAGGDGPVATVTDIEVHLSTARPMIEVASVNHPDALVSGEGARRIVGLSRLGTGLAKDLVVRWRQETEDMDLAVRAVRPDGDDAAYAEVRFSFDRDPFKALRAPRSVVLVIDASLSMAGEPLLRAQEAAALVVDALDENDRLEIITVGHKVEGYFGALSVADGDVRAAALKHISTLRTGGRTDLQAALSLAGERLDTHKDGVLVLLTDGQPTARAEGDDPFSYEVDVAQLGETRILVGHFNYPSTASALRASLPNVTVRYIPDGVAAEGAVRALARLAVAPTIQELEVMVEGGGVFGVEGALPDRLAVGEHVRLMARLESDAVVRIGGWLHGERIDLEAHIEVPAPRSLVGDGRRAPLAVEWARLRVARLEAELADLDDEVEREVVTAGIRDLGEGYGLATRFTSFVLTDSLHPDRIKPGDPEIRVHAPVSALGVFARLPWGEVVRCSWDAEEGLWLGRFLVPRATEDGLYRARVFVEMQTGTTYRGALFFRVDSQPPAFVLSLIDDVPARSGAMLSLLATPDDVPEDLGLDRIDRDPLDLRRVYVVVGDEVWPMVREVRAGPGGGDRFVVEGLLMLPPGAHVLRVVAEDWARNTQESELLLEVVP